MLAAKSTWVCGRCGMTQTGLTPHDVAECSARVHCDRYGHSWIPHPSDDTLQVCADCQAEDEAR